MSGSWRVRVQQPLAAADLSEPEPDVAVAQRLGRGKPHTAALVIDVTTSSHRRHLAHKPAVCSAAAVEQCWVIDLLTREVVVHRGPGPTGYSEVQLPPWTTQLSVLGITVDLSTLLAPLDQA